MLQRARDPVSRIFPPKDNVEMVTTTVRAPKDLLERLDEIAKEQGYSRSEVILHMLRWATAEYDAEKAEKKAPKK